jgi:hypothetical protein
MRCNPGRLILQTGAKSLEEHSDLRTGCCIPESGIYRVLHSQHNLPSEVTLLKDHFFPRCSRCAESVYFELVRSAPAGLNPYRFNVALYELPELAPDKPLAS